SSVQIAYIPCILRIACAIVTKQQEGRAMATLDRQIPSPDTFLCEPWSSFVSAAKLRFVDNSSLDNSEKELYCLAEAVRLSKEEMLVCSQFPALEDFYLVVCHVCNQVVTPHGIFTHYGKTHTQGINNGPDVA
uniref:Ataxin 7 like 1 n=1 Tax=Sander lucioperca TaxID=283035 RepID=A0A8D0D2S8_SANLU